MNEENYSAMWDKAHKFQDSYGDLMSAVDQAFELSRQRLAEDEELKRLRLENKEYQKENSELHAKIAEINRQFLTALAEQNGTIIKERDAAVADAAMWKKSYEDLVKCL
jgi:hypothetical protein